MRLKTILGVLLIAAIVVPASWAQPAAVASGTQNITNVRIKVWLQGPYNGGSMTTSLNPTYLPMSQPYSGASFVGTPMEYSGTEFVSDWTGARASVVDWVLVEVRTTTAAASKVATVAGLLMSDGLIKNTDGTSDLSIVGPAAGDYFIVVRHRNHIPIMSNSVVELTSTVPVSTYDMTIEGNIYSGVGAGGARNLGGGAFGLYAGDANGSGGTGAEDQAAWLADNGLAGYLDGDFNLSGGGGAEDQAIWLGNPSRSTLVPE